MSTPDTNAKDLLRDVKILIVDDEHYTRKVIHTLLLAIGCTKIFEAGDGAVGLEVMREVAPDVVLLDWEMPGIDGPEFVRQVRSTGSFLRPNVPIIMLTAHGERSRVLEAVRLGVHGFLLKPVASSTLRERILAVLSEPGKMMKRAGYHAPKPREPASLQLDADTHSSEAQHREATVKAAVDPNVSRVILLD